MKCIYYLSFICLCFILFFCYSCRKDNTKIIINGTIYDPNSNAYISGANVCISANGGITSGYYNSNLTTIATTTTDANGKFTFQFEKEKSAGYQIYISKTNYFDNIINIPDADVVAGTPYTPIYDFFKIAYLKLHVKNVSPYNTSDQIVYSYTSGYLNCYECCSDVYFVGNGMNYDSTYTCKTYGDQKIIVTWHVVKSADIFYTDTILCTPFDTTSYQILY